MFYDITIFIERKCLARREKDIATSVVVEFTTVDSGNPYRYNLKITNIVVCLNGYTI